MNTTVENGVLKVKFSGQLPRLEEKVIAKYVPGLAELFADIEQKGWKHESYNAEGTANISAKIEPTTSTIYKKIESDYDRCNGTTSEWERYVIETEVPAKYFEETAIESITGLTLNIRANDDKHGILGVRCNPVKKTLDHLTMDTMFLSMDSDKNVSRDSITYEMAKWLVEEKGFKLESSYDMSAYKRLTDKYGSGKTQVQVLLKLTINDAVKFGSLGDFKEELSKLALSKDAVIDIDIDPRKKDD